MKNMMIGMSLGMVGGMGIAAYCLANPNTKKNADKMINTAMDDMTEALDCMKHKKQ